MPVMIVAPESLKLKQIVALSLKYLQYFCYSTAKELTAEQMITYMVAVVVDYVLLQGHPYPFDFFDFA